MDIPVTFKSKNELGDMCEALRTSQHVLKEVIADECYLLEEMANGNFDVHSKNVDMYVGVLQSVLKSVRVILLVLLRVVVFSACIQYKRA